MNDGDKYIRYLPDVLALLGVAFQWFLRTFRGVSDWFTVPLAVCVTVAGVAVCTDWIIEGRDWHLYLIQTLLQLPGYVACVLGPMYAAAHAADAAVKMGANPDNVLIPKTNSK